MKLTQPIFMIFTIFVSVLNCSEQRPKGWKAVMSFSNPFATFRPSIISSGHAQYLGSIDDLNDEQRKNLKEFTSQLEIVKTATLIGSGICFLVAYKYGQIWPIFCFIVMGTTISGSYINTKYLRQLTKFQNKLDDAIKNKKS